ncbi:hybrid sensor histidine kinase/response regulator [Oxalobacteraceae bacterium CAVE-383]|nr:hybrid sensor histidine kinase/response regulator [Oxalobacteraceae bacterium CAVE-383]
MVDDEKNILAALRRLLHAEKYRILTANSAPEALELLASTPVDVIVSDQRMPDMTGVEFFRIAKERYPETIRIMLSGYTELQSVTDAVNEGAIYKFLTKPWDDNQLKTHVAEAFHRKGLSDENARLHAQLRLANAELANANAQLEGLVQKKERQIHRDEIMLDVVHEVLRHLPLAVIGLDNDNLVVLANIAAEQLGAGNSLLGKEIESVMPALLQNLTSEGEARRGVFELEGKAFDVLLCPMGQHSLSRGRLLTLCRQDERKKRRDPT